MISLKIFIRIFVSYVLCIGIANAHIVLADQLAAAGSYYKATLRVGHGCGDEPTTAIIVKIPAGFEGAKPQPQVWLESSQLKKSHYPSPLRATAKPSRRMWWKSNGRPAAKTFICRMNSLMSFHS
jgi:periplasmic copper chaperone A